MQKGQTSKFRCLGKAIAEHHAVSVALRFLRVCGRVGGVTTPVVVVEPFAVTLASVARMPCRTNAAAASCESSGFRLLTTPDEKKCSTIFDVNARLSTCAAKFLGTSGWPRSGLSGGGDLSTSKA